VTTASKFLLLGLTLKQVIERVTTNAAQAFGFAKGIGTLREGAHANVAVLSFAEGNFELSDTRGVKRLAKQKLTTAATVKSGQIYGSASIPVE
jgi:predicted amidohydrolase